MADEFTSEFSTDFDIEDGTPPVDPSDFTADFSTEFN